MSRILQTPSENRPGSSLTQRTPRPKQFGSYKTAPNLTQPKSSRSLDSNDLTHLISQRLHPGLTKQGIIALALIERTALSPDSPQRCARRIRRASFPRLLLDNLQLLQRHIAHAPLFARLLLKLSEQLVRRRREGVDDQDLILALLWVLERRYY
jgi:hypothetical protein